MSDSPTVTRLGQALGKMTDRERKLIFVTAGVAALLIVVGIGWLIGGAIEAREKRITVRQDEIAQIEALRADYDGAVARQKAAENRIRTAASTSLFSLLQKSAADVGLSLADLQERRTPVKDSELTEVTVDVNLKEISVDKLVTLLEKIEGRSSGGVIKVTKLKVKTRFDNPEVLEASLTVSTWKAPNAPSGQNGAVGGAAVGAPDAGKPQ